jgi:hypothetical protein
LSPPRVERLGQPRAARDVEEEHGDLGGPLLELGRVRILFEQSLHGLGHELRQLSLDLLEELEPLTRLV